MYEIYELRLDHYIEDKGDRHLLEEPLVIRMVNDRRYAPISICINDMIDKMRYEMLKRVDVDISQKVGIGHCVEQEGER